MKDRNQLVQFIVKELSGHDCHEIILLKLNHEESAKLGAYCEATKQKPTDVIKELLRALTIPGGIV